MGNRGSSRNSEEITTRAGDKTRMKKIDKDIRKTFFFDKDLVDSLKIIKLTENKFS